MMEMMPQPMVLPRSNPVPERRCIMSHQSGDPITMVRFVANPDGVITPDVAAKLPGRGAWVTADRAMLGKAASSGKLARALGGKLPAGDLAEQVDRLLVKRCQEGLAMGRRGGITLGGGGKIKAEGQVFGLLIASDASAREARALRGDVMHDWVISTMTSDEIGAPFGRPMAFVAIVNGQWRQAQHLAGELKRLDGLRSSAAERPK